MLLIRNKSNTIRNHIEQKPRRAKGLSHLVPRVTQYREIQFESLYKAFVLFYRAAIHTYNLRTYSSKFTLMVTKAARLGSTSRCMVFGIEKNDQRFPFEGLG